MQVEAEFVTSAAGPDGFPAGRLPEVAFVGRSNVGKSTLINALVRRTVARTSAAPGKTRLVNVYRVQAGALPAFHLVDLPGYGYARGGEAAAGAFAALTEAYFGSRWGSDRDAGAPRLGALLLVDARHPGLANDRAAYDWLAALEAPGAVVATKFDKLSRAERSRAQRALETAFNGPVLPVSAVSGEGLKDLWKLIERLLSSHPPRLTPRPR